MSRQLTIYDVPYDDIPCVWAENECPHKASHTEDDPKPENCKKCLVTNACIEGNLKKLKSLVREGADILFLDGYPLLFAVRNLHFSIVRYLVRHGANVSINSRDGVILRESLYDPELDMVKYLVSKGGNLKVAFSKESIPHTLCSLVSDRRLDALEYLVSEGVDIHVKDQEAFKIALQFVNVTVRNSGLENFDVINFFLENGAVIDGDIKKRFTTNKGPVLKYFRELSRKIHDKHQENPEKEIYEEKSANESQQCEKLDENPPKLSPSEVQFNDLMSKISDLKSRLEESESRNRELYKILEKTERLRLSEQVISLLH